MTLVPEIDLPITDIILGKKAVVYLPNTKGEFPNSYDKSFIPSSIVLTNNWFVGYAANILEDFNMIEISDSILQGLQFCNIVDGTTKKYDKFGRINPDEEKILITLTTAELEMQLSSKAFLLSLEASKIFASKIKLLYSSYFQAERDTWTIQYDEAQAYTADATATVPFITTLAAARGIALDELVVAILVKAEYLRNSLATLLGEKQKFEDRIVACTTDAELVTILDELSSIA
jgi:hypothetical protein